MTTEVNSSIAKKLILYVILFSSLITLIATAFQLYSEYDRDIKSIDSRFEEIQKIHLNSLASRVWVADELEINEQLNGIKNLPFIYYLEVIDNNKILAKIGNKKSQQVISKIYPILYKYQGKKLNIGTLLVQASLSSVYDHIYQQLWKILLANAIKTFLVSGFILYLFNLLVTRHLINISRFTNNLSISNLDQKLDAKRDNNEKIDEIDVLIQSLDRMQTNLKTSVIELEKAEKDIFESRERYRNLLETSFAIPWEFDLLSEKFTYIGPQAVKLLGYPVEQWYERKFWEKNMHPEDRNSAIDFCIAQSKIKSEYEFEYRMINSTNANVWIRDTVNVICNESGPAILRGFMFDITTQKITELAIKEKEALAKQHQKTLLYLAKNQSIRDNSIQPASTLTNETICKTLNASASAIWIYNNDYSRLQCIDCYDVKLNAHITRKDVFIDTGQSYTPLDSDVTQILKTTTDRPKLLHFDDHNKYTSLEALITRGEKVVGKILVERESENPDWDIEEKAFINSTADIISLTLEYWKHAQTSSQLAEYQKDLESLVESRTHQVHEQAIIIDQIHDAVISTDLCNCITSWNKGAEQLFSYSAHEIIGKPIDLLFPKMKSSMFDENLFTQLVSTGNIEIETSMFNKTNNEFYALLSLSLLHDIENEPKGIVCYALDISIRKAAEESLLQQTAELSAVNKELEAFAYSVSHDLRTPLRSISGFSNALLEEYNHVLDDTGQNYLRRVDKAAQHMASLIDSILNLSRVTRKELKYESINLNRLINDIIEQNNYNPEIFVIENNLEAFGDTSSLKIALTNLIDNAVKYSAYSHNPEIIVGKKENKDGTVFYIQDNGVGYDEQYAKNLFLPFQRLHDDSQFEGTGIGLATVQRIIDKHHGKLWAESTLDEGATFYFTIGKYYNIH